MEGREIPTFLDSGFFDAACSSFAHVLSRWAATCCAWYAIDERLADIENEKRMTLANICLVFLVLPSALIEESGVHVGQHTQSVVDEREDGAIPVVARASVEGREDDGHQ